jgi:hypothetical protein
MAMATATQTGDWVLLAPWYEWSKSTTPRQSAPALQK